MNFKNFIPPTLKDSIKINRVLNKETTLTKVYDLDDYNFINPSNNNKPVNEHTALSELIVDLSAILPSQTAKIPPFYLVIAQCFQVFTMMISRFLSDHTYS